MNGWRKSSYSGGGQGANCADGPRLNFTPAEWMKFIEGIKA